MLAQEKSQAQGLTPKELAKVKRLKVGFSSQSCTICLKRFEKGELIRQLPCRHIFHSKGCVDPWLVEHPACPVCRTNLRAIT